MDRAGLLRRASSGEERVLLARVLDKYEQMERRNIPTSTPFLSQAEQAAVQALLNAAGIHSGYVWNGGYADAERKLLQFLPDWAEEGESALGAVRATYHGTEAPGHRDLLGSLMGLGLTREKLGDLLVSPQSCDVVVSPELVPFLVQSWTSAGRIKLSVSALELSQLLIPQQQFKSLRDTVASLRLDAVAAVGFSMSRGKAAELIAAGRVQLNHVDCLKGDRAVTQGDVITARGLGKCVLSEVGGLSKKGRISITVLRYL